ncbi:MAG: diguanylate cyclase, partial [Gammaproteobacteria bacterium]|nr:diguanylate cyclase [Gammaproteobacteria bacterium]
MSIRKQLIILVSTLVMLVFAGTLFISVKNTQGYLNEQLKVHAQDTATSLGLSLIPALRDNDRAKADSLINAIFDRGYYSEIQLLNNEKIWIDKNMDIWTENAPGWFISMMPLEAPSMSSELTVEWVPSAKLNVTVYTGHAYDELWTVAKHNFFWLILLSSSIYLIIFFGLKKILIPLDLTEKQALAIANREFIVQKQLPKTRELQNVVKAMNHMSSKVKENFTEQVDLIKKYKDMAYIDALTGKINKRGLIAEIESFVCNQEEFLNGAFYIVHLSGIDEINKTQGYSAGDKIIEEVAKCIDKSHMSAHSVVSARIAGADFGVLLKNPYKGESEEMICKILEQYSSNYKHSKDRQIYIGLTEFNSEKNSSSLFSEADLALRAAQSVGTQNWSKYERDVNEKHTVRTASQWREVIKTMIEQDAIELYIQPVHFFSDNQSACFEVLARINESGNLIPAGTFMPMAEHHGLCEDIDKRIIKKLLQQLHVEKHNTYA